MVNDKVGRYRPMAFLILAGLALFGPDAGHLAPRALGAGVLIPARAVFGDVINLNVACGLKGDGLGYSDLGYLQPNEYLTGIDCVEGDASGRWVLQTPARTGCSAVRSYTLVLGTSATPC